MGYFPNGTSGEMYYEHYCSRCIHDDPEKEVHCPVWGLHLMYNYEECNKENSYLHVLIPRDKEKLDNKQCTMFVERQASGDLYDGSTAAKCRSMADVKAAVIVWNSK